MKKINDTGVVGGLALSMIALSVVAIVAIILAAKFYSGEQNYKNNDQLLIDQAAQAAKAQEAALKDKQFAIENQSPFVTYTGPVQYGSVNISYPKSWSAYVDTTGSNPLEVYFNPGYVPAVTGSGNIYALRMEINSNTYAQELSNYTSQQQSGGLTISPYSLPKVPRVVGVIMQGQISSNNTSATGVKILLPLRTNTLEIWTDSMQYASLLQNQVLPLVTFQP